MVGAVVLLGLVSGLRAQSSDALSGRFSIRSNGEQVVFSRGNLCLQIENSAWYFAAHQYDIIGTLNIFGGALSTPIDLYGYSGSTYYNWGVSPVNANSLFGGDFVDWGENAIGDSPAGFWRTLSYAEWDYLLNQRTNAAALRGVATVGQQTGLVLLPDTATSTIPATYTTDEWAAAEANGAVFLPFAGRRIRANRVDSINTRGYYWTSTTFSADYAGLVNLGTTGVSLEQSERMHGHSVRLIHSIGIQRDSIYRISVGSDCSCSDIPDTKAEALTFLLSADGCPNQRSYLFAYRDQVILTAVAEECKEFVAWSDGNTENPRTIRLTGSMTLSATFRDLKYRVSYVNYDGSPLLQDSVFCGETPTLPTIIPTREATAEYTYTFVGWTPEFDTVKGNQVYTATYDSTINRYPVDFVDYNGTLLLSDTLDYGTTPAYTGTTLPSRESTVAYEYSFSGWTPAFAPVVGPQTYTAVYDSVSLLYQVTFLDYDGTILLTGSYDYGETPAYTGATLPSRDATAEYTYTFTGWTPAFAPVTEDQTYTAQYDSVVNRYRIEYLDYDGTLLFFDTLAYGMRPAYQGTEPQRAATAEYTYAFIGWTPSAVPVTSAQIYTAQYDSTVNRYQVRYFDYDGALLMTDSVSYGIVPSYQGTTPSREATAQYTYSFVAWTPAFDTVHADQAYTAVYDSVINRYQVTYSDFDGTLLMIDSVAYDLVPVYQGNPPMREATAQYTYTFAAWTPALDTVRGDQYYTATYDSVINRYEIIFEDYDEAELQTDTLDYGTLPAFTNILPPREGTAEYTYVFTGWTPSIDFVTGPQTYTAQYDSTINRYQVTYLDFDSTRIAADSVAYGETPAYSGTLPTREATAQYTYTFTGWTPLYEPVTGDQTYMAQYDSTVNRYQIDFRDFDGTLLLSDSLDYGLMPAYAGSALPSREATVQYTYSFAGWTPAIDTVTGDQTYTAQYDSTVNRYEVRYYDYDSTLILTDSVAYGVMPVYPGTTPQREATAEYTYAFVTWTPALDFVSGDQAYMAVYDSTLNRYQVTYRDFDGTQLRVDSLDYGMMPAYTGATPARTATAQYTYTFTGWTPALDFVVADQTYTAQYDSVVNRYEVRFVNYDGTLLQADTIAYGTRPAYTGSTPTRATTEAYSYTFRTWTPAITPVTGAATYTATYDSTAVLYAIRFLNYDSTVLYQRQLSYGTLPVYSGRTPTRPATAEFTYTFTGWFPTLTEVTGDQDYIATFHGTRNRYEVIFRDYDGTTLLTDSVEYGQTPAYTGATPTRDANAQYTYTFTGWTPALAATTANAVYTALYDSIVNQYSITFLNYDLTVLQVSNVDYGTMPMYQGSEPQKAATQQWTYHFVDWTPELTLVTEAATYTAVFDSTINRYTLTLTGDNATLIGAGTYDYGTVVSVEAVADEGYHFVEWSDGEWRNPREVTVLDHMSLTALIELDCVGLNSVPVEKIYEWLLLVNVSGLEQLGYSVTEDDVTWYRAIGEVDDPEHKDDDELVGRGFYLKVGASYAGFGRFYAVVDVSGSMHVGDNLCTGLIRSQVVPVGLTDIDETAEAWAPYLYPAALHPYETLTVHGLRPNQATRIRVYDVAGHMLHEERAERDESEAILTAPAIAGTYLVELKNDSEQVVLRFIVLQ